MRLAVFILIAFSAGGLLFGYSLRSHSDAYKRDRWIKYWIYLFIVLSVVTLISFGPLSAFLLVSAICVRGAYELYDAANQAKTTGGTFYLRTWAVYIPLALLCVLGASLAATDLVLFVFVVIATFDAASQIAGQLLGRRKLAPVLSPHKTVEGFAGGILAAILAATLFQALASLSTLQAIEYGIALCLIGLTGDLSASWVKRHARIKDYRQAFPGHGGVLDRFDSFIPNCAILGLLSLDPVLSG